MSDADRRRAVARYRWQRHRIPGWLGILDMRVLWVVDAVQRAAVIGGDVLEIGVYQGKTAILLGHLLRDGERLVAADLFETTPNDAEQAAESAQYYAGLTASDFEARFRRHHRDAPLVIAGDSRDLPSLVAPTSCRLVHVDGGHTHDIVATDLRTAMHAAAQGAVVVVDDVRRFGLPGVAAATWAAVAAGDLEPVVHTPDKLYAVRPGDAIGVALRDAMRRAAPDAAVRAVGDAEVVCVPAPGRLNLRLRRVPPRD